MFGKHAAYILPSYGISLFVILAIVIWIVLTHRSRRAEIVALEKRGIKRASSGNK